MGKTRNSRPRPKQTDEYSNIKYMDLRDLLVIPLEKFVNIGQKYMIACDGVNSRLEYSFDLY